jgi:hypothetical protein
LLRVNALAHKAASIFTFWPPKVTKLYHPPHPTYYPHLSMSDYFLLPMLKMKLKGPDFADVAEI